MTARLTMKSVERDRTIFFVTADNIIDSHTVTWMYKFAKKSNGDPVVPANVQNIVCKLPFAYLWPDFNADGSLRDRSRPYNVFINDGLSTAGGFQKYKPPAFPNYLDGAEDDSRMSHLNWQLDMLENIPACSMLCRTEDLRWLEDHILIASGRSYVEFHSDAPISTS